MADFIRTAHGAPIAGAAACRASALGVPSAAGQGGPFLLLTPDDKEWLMQQMREAAGWSPSRAFLIAPACSQTHGRECAGAAAGRGGGARQE